jgi:hypothetical protein
LSPPAISSRRRVAPPEGGAASSCCCVQHGWVTDQPDQLLKAVLDGLLQHGIPVRAAREAAGLTLPALAERSDVDAARLKAFETRTAKPSPVEANAIALATGVPAGFFI